jgi:hypothetical protein
MQGIENPDNFGIEFHLLKKNPLRAPGFVGLKTRAAGITGDADGFCLESGAGC